MNLKALIASTLDSKAVEDTQQLLHNHIQRCLRAAGVTTPQGFLPADEDLAFESIDALLANLEGKDTTKIGPNFRYHYMWGYALTRWGLRYDGGDFGWCTYVYDIQFTNVVTEFGNVVVAVLYRGSGLRTLVRVWDANNAPHILK